MADGENGLGGQVTERRTARRYDLSLPVGISVLIGRGAVSCKGRTRDISTHGVYLMVGSELSVGTEIDLTMTLPSDATGGTEVFIRAIGKVMRVEKKLHPREGCSGVAVVIQRYEIVRSQSANVLAGSALPV